MSPSSSQNLAEAFYAEGVRLIESSDHKSAASILRVGAALSCDDRIWLALGRCHEELGETRLALVCYMGARAVCPAPVRSLVAAARIFAAEGDSSKAAELMAEAIDHARSIASNELMALAEGGTS